MIRRLGLFLRMTRLKVVVTLWTFLLIGLARHTADLDPPRLGLAILALAAGYAVATSANDISDEAIDRVNRPRDADRPTGSQACGDASRQRAWPAVADGALHW